MSTVVLTKDDGEKYLFRFDPCEESLTQLRRHTAKMAKDPELTFDWSDCAQVCDAARRLAEAYREEHPLAPWEHS